MLNLFIAFAVAALLSFLLAIPQRLLALRFGFVDAPDERRAHLGIRPRLGGVSMLLAFAAGLVAASYAFDTKPLAVIGGATLLVVAGSVDDKRMPDGRELNPIIQLAIQLIAAGIAVAAGVQILDVRDPRAPAPFGGLLHLPLWATVLFTLFWIAGMINTVNFLDGMDGLAGGVCAIASLVLAFVSLRLGQLDVALLCFALAGVAAGFLPHNIYPARTFMGTSGAWFLGYCLAALSIIGGAKLATALLVIGVPVFDVALLILLRTLRGQRFWQGDRAHLHHRLLDVGLSQRSTLILYYSLSAAFGLYAFAFTSNTSVGLGPKLYGLAALVAIMVCILTVLTRRQARAK